LRWLGCSPVFADQAAYDPAALDPGGHIDGLAGLTQRRSLVQRLVRPVAVVNAVHTQPAPSGDAARREWQVIKALAAKCSYESFRK
jgi:hypothetical protein